MIRSCERLSPHVVHKRTTRIAVHVLPMHVHARLWEKIDGRVLLRNKVVSIGPSCMPSRKAKQHPLLHKVTRLLDAHNIVETLPSMSSDAITLELRLPNSWWHDLPFESSLKADRRTSLAKVIVPGDRWRTTK